uniref:Chromosome 15 open reading frame 39 n=1 Tax=Chrysolophus pictus TaxID=9089 RepID=A0A8C3LKN4_CHRPC
MASKRHSEPLDAILFHKLPRLEAEPDPGIPSIPCKPNPAPTAGPETHLGYKGSYFSCPQAEGQLLHCLLRQPHSPTGRPGAEQGKNHPMWDPLLAQDKWPSPQGHPIPLKKPPAVPKPVYAAPLCFSPLSSQGGDTLQRGPGAMSAVPPPSPVTLSHYYTAFEKYRGPAAVHDQGKAPEIPTCIPDPWMKAHREHPSACYPQPPYPQPPGSFSYKAFGFMVNGKSSLFPSTYLKPPAPQSHYPSPLDCFASRPAAPGTLPSLKAMGPPRDLEPSPLPPAGYLHPNPAFAFSPMDAVLFTEHRSDGRKAPLEAHGGRVVTRHSSAFHPIHTLQKTPDGLLGSFPKGEAGYSLDKAMTANPVPCQQQVVKGGVGDATKEHFIPCRAICPQERLRDRQSGDVSPPSPPMPVINKVFSLAPYREYLEGTEGSDVPKEHPQGDTPTPQNSSSGQEPAGIKVTSSSLRGEGESCHQKTPEGPKTKPVSPEPPAGTQPGLQDSGGEPTPGDVALDLSLKKSLVTTGSTHAEGMLDPGEKEGPLGQVEVAEDTNVPLQLVEAGGDTKPQVPPNQVELDEDTKAQVPAQLVEVSSRDRSHFQSSAAFMFKKYKILKSWGPPGAPQPSSPPHTWQGSPSTSVPQEPCHNTKPVDTSPALLRAPLPTTPCHIPAQPCVVNQGFSALHMSLCSIISCSVSASSPELLRDWLRRTEPGDTLAETPRSLPKTKNVSKLPEPQKPPKGKEIWLAFRNAATLLSKLLAQLEAFTFTRKCPFPYVLRAGAIFIPIHVVKEKLFPELPGASVDQVLQKHKVELRPTTLSEEKLLRELELKGCTSRMLKLLALKQLPEIYPDLLNLLWHHSIQQQLGSRSEVGQ